MAMSEIHLELLDLLGVVRSNDLCTPIPRCGKLLKIAKRLGLVDEDAEITLLGRQLLNEHAILFGAKKCQPLLLKSTKT